MEDATEEPPMGAMGVRGGVAGRPGMTGAKALRCLLFPATPIPAVNWERRAAEEEAQEEEVPQDPWWPP